MRRGMFLCIALFLLLGREATAAVCSAPEGAGSALAARDAHQRMTFIRDHLRQQGRSSRIWTRSWLGINTAFAVGAFGLAPFTADRGDRTDLIAVGAMSTASLATLLLLPLEVDDDEKALEAKLAAAPSPAEPCAQLAEAERLFAHAAHSEALGAGPLSHLLNIAVNAAAGAVLWLGYDRLESGAVNAGLGLIFGELTILTQPTRLIGAQERYLRGELGGAVSSLRPAVMPWARAGSAGVAAFWEF